MITNSDISRCFGSPSDIRCPSCRKKSDFNSEELKSLAKGEENPGVKCKHCGLCFRISRMKIFVTK